jgi:hypothetical protein
MWIRTKSIGHMVKNRMANHRGYDPDAYDDSDDEQSHIPDISVKEAKQTLKTTMQEQLDEFFENNGKRAWDTDRWDKQREEHLGEVCQWCGESEETLNLHHTDSKHEVKKNWKRVWMHVEDKLFKESDSFDESMLGTTECCPKCNKRNFYHRKTMNPPFRCQACDHEFGDPGEKPSGEPEDDYFLAKVEWVSKNVEQILDGFENRYEAYWDDYFDLSQDSVVTICKTCHFNWHENYRKPCEFCEDGYGKARTDHDVIQEFEDQMGEKVRTEGVYLCWEHFAELKCLEECSCGDGWYNPDYNTECKSCRRGGS